MIKNKETLITSFILLGICMSLFFPFPNNGMIEARSTIMSFPIRNSNGYILLGIIGSILFIIAIILLARSLKKYHLRTIVIVLVVYTLLPYILIMLYQETFASGINAISYDGNGNCNFLYVNDDVLDGECSLVLHNRSNTAVSFDLEFLDSLFMDDGARMESLMNLAGPYHITVEANEKKSIHLRKLLDLSDVPNHIEGGSSSNINIKIVEEDAARTL
ncbi:hypothetical protein [Ferdinandcohnia sp. Marseille-Q9671]